MEVWAMGAATNRAKGLQLPDCAYEPAKRFVKGKPSWTTWTEGFQPVDVRRAESRRAVASARGRPHVEGSPRGLGV